MGAEREPAGRLALVCFPGVLFEQGQRNSVRSQRWLHLLPPCPLPEEPNNDPRTQMNSVWETSGKWALEHHPEEGEQGNAKVGTGVARGHGSHRASCFVPSGLAKPSSPHTIHASPVVANKTQPSRRFSHSHIHTTCVYFTFIQESNIQPWIFQRKQPSTNRSHPGQEQLAPAAREGLMERALVNFGKSKLGGHWQVLCGSASGQVSPSSCLH